ncbi:MAG: glycosyltransferase [Patescibacteria group bacterium]|nr:glycosyltransferase [Patescibacteria group bacterium]
MLSIIIPTYNEEQLLPRLLASIKEQDYCDYEIIVADAASSDRTPAIAAEFGARVVPGGLPPVGRNRGAATTTGEKILFLDADVVLPRRDFLSSAIQEFDSRALDIATCRVDPIGDKKIDKLFHWFYNFYTACLASIRPHAPGFCILVRRHLHEKLGGFDEEIKLAEDQDYSQRAAKLGQFGFLSEYLPVSTRRFERDGRLNVIFKYVICEFYMMLFGGPKSDIFKYRFGYPKDKTLK